jgi:hypothetical protein
MMSAQGTHKRKKADAEEEPPDNAVPNTEPSARVPITAGFADGGTARWLTSPYELEQLFRQHAGHFIPGDYVKRFETWLNSGRFFTTRPRSLSDRWSDVLYCHAMVEWTGDEPCVELHKYFSRPCAFGLRFVWHLYHYILRFCHFHGLPLVIKEPAPTTVAFVHRTCAAGGVDAHVERASGNGVAYITLPVASLPGFAVGMGIIDTGGWARISNYKDHARFALPEEQRLTLDPARFPPAMALNEESDEEADGG